MEEVVTLVEGVELKCIIYETLSCCKPHFYLFLNVSFIKTEEGWGHPGVGKWTLVMGLVLEHYLPKPQLLITL